MTNGRLFRLPPFILLVYSCVLKNYWKSREMINHRRNCILSILKFKYSAIESILMDEKLLTDKKIKRHCQKCVYT